VAHVAQQIRAWAKAACTGYGALPAPVDKAPRQRQAGDQHVVIGYGTESVEAADVHTLLERGVQLRITAMGDDLDAVDDLIVDVEKAIAAAVATYPGTTIGLIDREYDESTEGDEYAAACTATYLCEYYTAKSDPELAL